MLLTRMLDFVHGTVLPQLDTLHSNKRGIEGFAMPPSWLSTNIELPWKGKKSGKALPLYVPGYIPTRGPCGTQYHNGSLSIPSQTLDNLGVLLPTRNGKMACNTG